jgi:hypothetical protein
VALKCTCGRNAHTANRFGVPRCWQCFFRYPLPKVRRARIVEYERPNYGIASDLERVFGAGNVREAGERDTWMELE